MHRMTYSSVHLCNPPEAISDGRLNPATDTSLLLAACGGRLRYLPYTPQCASSRSVFLLYRKAISCKIKKTTHPRLIYCHQTLWSLSFFMFISIFFCRLPLRRPPYWKHPVFCKSAVYGISHLRWSYSVLPQFFLLTYHLPAILKSLS